MYIDCFPFFHHVWTKCRWGKGLFRIFKMKPLWNQCCHLLVGWWCGWLFVSRWMINELVAPPPDHLRIWKVKFHFLSSSCCSSWTCDFTLTLFNVLQMEILLLWKPSPQINTFDSFLCQKPTIKSDCFGSLRLLCCDFFFCLFSFIPDIHLKWNATFWRAEVATDVQIYIKYIYICIYSCIFWYLCVCISIYMHWSLALIWF